MKKLLLIDGHNLLFKMFFGMPFRYNLNLIELPNRLIDLTNFSLENYQIEQKKLKNFKNLKLVIEITNKLNN